MLRIVIVEDEVVAKDVIFLLNKVLEQEFVFTYYEKNAELIRDIEKQDVQYDVIILNESHTHERVVKTIEYYQNDPIYLYLCNSNQSQRNSIHGTIFYLDVNYLKEEMQQLQVFLNQQLRHHEEYLLAYNGVTVRLKYSDIFYVEKRNKNLIYYTKKGKFYERASMNKKVESFQRFDFIQIHSGILINYDYIFKIEQEEVELKNHQRLPIARARKQNVLKFMRKKTNFSI